MHAAAMAYIPSPPVSPPDFPASPLATYGEPAPPRAHAVLVLEPDDVRNTVLRTLAGRAAYEVRTDGRGDTTDVRVPACDGDVCLATVHRKAFAPSVTRNGTRLAVRRWLRPAIAGDRGVTFEAHGRAYRWKQDTLGNLTLVDEAYPDLVIAWFVRSRKRVLDGSHAAPGRAYLALEEEADAIRDDVILSFLIVEESLRLSQRKGRA